MAFLPDAADSGFFFFTFDRRCYRFCRWTLYNKFPTGFIISVSKKLLVGETPDQGEAIQKDFSARNMLITANATGK
jgi:hypothetical protein